MHKTVHRLLLLFVAFAAGSVSLVAVAPSANAASFDTKPLIQASKGVVVHGAGVKIQGCVTVPSYGPGCAPYGSLQLERRLVGQTAWVKVLAQQDLVQTGGLPTWTFKPTVSASYRVRFSGANDGVDTFNAAESSATVVRVARNLKDRWARRAFRFSGKVTPSHGRKAVYIQRTTCNPARSNSCRWTTHKRIRSTASGAWSVKLPAKSRTTYFRAYVKASGGYASSYSNLYIKTRRY